MWTKIALSVASCRGLKGTLQKPKKSKYKNFQTTTPAWLHECFEVSAEQKKKTHIKPWRQIP
jgi:hypothetical protein